MAYQSFFAKTAEVNVAPRGGATGATGATESPPVLSKPHVDMQPAQPYDLIVTLDAARTALALLAGQQVAFDLETTGLDPLSDRVRLLSIAPLSGGKPLVLDLFRIGGVKLLREELKQLRGIAHNAAFDLAFRRQGSEQVYEIVRDALPAVVQMHLNGVPFNKVAHASLVEELQTELDLIKPKLIVALGGRKPSGNDLQDFLTEGLGGQDPANYSGWPRTKSGKQLSTARDDLLEYLHLLDAAHQDIVRDFLLPLLEIESVTKTFGTKLVDQLHAVTGRLTPNFSLTGTATGRLSSSEPNIQGFPRRAAFRETIAAPAGRMLVIADYNAMELRVAAQIAGETTLIEGFKAGEDPHRLTAALLLKKPFEQVTKDERQLAKAVNFGLLFGQGPKGLSAYAQKTYGVKMAVEEADAYRKAWFAAYPAIQTWQRQHDRQCSSTLSVRTPSGRVRRWTNHVWGTYGGYKSTEAYNTPIQGGAAECMLVAMARLVSVLGTQALDAALVASVHDELIVECSEHDADVVIGILEEAMTFGFAAIFPDAPTNGLVEARKVKTWAKE